MSKKIERPPLETEGTGTLSSAEIQIKADKIFELLRVLPSPKDAATVLTTVYLNVLQAAFPPEYRNEAKKAVDTFAEFVKSELDEGWQ